MVRNSICRVRALDDKCTDAFTTLIRQLNSASQKALSSPFRSPSPLKLIILLDSIIIGELCWFFLIKCHPILIGTASFQKQIYKIVSAVDEISSQHKSFPTLGIDIVFLTIQYRHHLTLCVCV